MQSTLPALAPHASHLLGCPPRGPPVRPQIRSMQVCEALVTTCAITARLHGLLGFPPTEAPSAPFNHQHRHSSISSQSSPHVTLNSPYVRSLDSPVPNLPSFRPVRIHTRPRPRIWHIPALIARPCRPTRNIILLAIARFTVRFLLSFRAAHRTDFSSFRWTNSSLPPRPTIYFCYSTHSCSEVCQLYPSLPFLTAVPVLVTI